MRQARKRVARSLQLGNLGIKGGDTVRRKFPGPGSLVGGVQCEQLCDLLEREPRRLG